MGPGDGCTAWRAAPPTRNRSAHSCSTAPGTLRATRAAGPTRLRRIDIEGAAGGGLGGRAAAAGGVGGRRAAGSRCRGGGVLPKCCLQLIEVQLLAIAVHQPPHLRRALVEGLRPHWRQAAAGSGSGTAAGWQQRRSGESCALGCGCWCCGAGAGPLGDQGGHPVVVAAAGEWPRGAGGR